MVPNSAGETNFMSWDSLVCIVTSLRAGKPLCDTPQGFFFYHYVQTLSSLLSLIYTEYRKPFPCDKVAGA